MDRKVFFFDRTRSDECFKETATEEGHWEKTMKKVDHYFFVGG